VKEIVEKQAVEIDFGIFKVNDRPKKQGFDKNDISNKKKEDEIERYISEGNKSIQDKKEKKKQKKAEKDE
jgi:hypothetical protein